MYAILDGFLPIFSPFVPIIKNIFFTPCMKRHSLWNVLLLLSKPRLISVMMINFPRHGLLFDQASRQEASQIHLIRRREMRVLHGLF